MKERIKALISAVESVTPTAVKILLAGAGIVALLLFRLPVPTDPAQSTVMITNSKRTSGGTGVIHASSPGSTTIITNSHVCGVVENGGLVIHNNNPYVVSTYKRSELYDLCLITIPANLGTMTALAERPPNQFEKARVAGHPALLPTVVSEGHFSGKEIVEVLTGFEPCTNDNLEGPFGLVCMLIGGKPIIKSYESQLVTATIMPGSSGSGVYNSNNELTGLVFAGQGEFGYGWTVPYGSLISFLRAEAPLLTATKVGAFNPYAHLKTSKRVKTFQEYVIDVKKVCKSDKADDIKNICKVIKSDLLWNQ